jgi:hypothetical protein
MVLDMTQDPYISGVGAEKVYTHFRLHLYYTHIIRNPNHPSDTFGTHFQNLSDFRLYAVQTPGSRMIQTHTSSHKPT